MPLYLLIPTLTVHVLSGVFWAGSTSAMANTGSADAAKLFPFQMGAAAGTIVTGVGLWWFQLGARFETHEQILLTGIAAAFIAGVVQATRIGPARRALLAAGPSAEGAALVKTMTDANRLSSGLLIITVASMIVARFF